MFDFCLSTHLLSTDILSIVMQKKQQGMETENTTTPPLPRKANTKRLGAAKGEHARHVFSKL